LIVPDLVCMGYSDEIPAGAEAERYHLAGHACFVAAFIDESGSERLTLVLDDG
jgi:hypothetical protein